MQFPDEFPDVTDDREPELPAQKIFRPKSCGQTEGTIPSRGGFPGESGENDNGSTELQNWR
jgi:hypothetical protein